MVKSKIRPLNMAKQAGKLKAVFPLSSVKLNQVHLKWEGTLTPTPLSDTYYLKLLYKKGNHPDVYVTSPILKFYPGTTKLPHVYNTSEQHLCLYYRPAREWNSSLFISDTIIPWASEWLFFYEIWLSTGVWHGGGIHSITEAEKQAEKQKENNNESSNTK